MYFFAVVVEVVAVGASLPADEEDEVDAFGELFEPGGSVGDAAADGVVGDEEVVGGVDACGGDVLFYVVDEVLVIFFAFGGLGVEADGTGEVDGCCLVGAADDDGVALGLAAEADDFGVAGFAEYDYLSFGVEGVHFFVSAAYALLECEDDGAGGVDELQSEGVDECVGGGWFAVGAYHDFGVLGREFGQFSVVYHLQSSFFEPAHFGGVVDDVAEAVESAVARQFFFGGAYCFDYAETESCIVVDGYLHVFSRFLVFRFLS